MMKEVEKLAEEIKDEKLRIMVLELLKTTSPPFHIMRHIPNLSSSAK